MGKKYLNLLDLLKQTGFTFEEIATMIGLTRKGLYNKIYGITQFTVIEIITIQNLINGTLGKKYTLEQLLDIKKDD